MGVRKQQSNWFSPAALVSRELFALQRQTSSSPPPWCQLPALCPALARHPAPTQRQPNNPTPPTAIVPHHTTPHHATPHWVGKWVLPDSSIESGQFNEITYFLCFSNFRSTFSFISFTVSLLFFIFCLELGGRSRGLLRIPLSLCLSGLLLA